ncbi:helix-turn-helix domain containing protein [Pseudomonas guariconensis]|uniref:helix-turn-helix domain-containing protein n=1 Tax=Pseudomonas TaxID=286 RepID=UPI0020974D3F|nr:MULTISPECIES: helix-turn-helix domain-containing protein [Pseudomonas]MCO7516932.1 helix-turn-helix domain containing protein [Pseudomonas putida]MCO7604140.1 helix-turn-helix domain containing protein [Pseudomonas guariconensis]
MSNKCLPAILGRLKLMTGSSTDAELAKALDVSPQTLSSWKVRERIPYALCIDLALAHGLSLDWLLLGEGAQVRTPAAPSDATTAPGWEPDLMRQLQGLSPGDLQAIRANVEDKLRLYQLEQRVDELSNRLAGR